MEEKTGFLGGQLTEKTVKRNIQDWALGGCSQRRGKYPGLQGGR
jgi:hypothetical protein